jgi:hypothetical protein
MPYIILIPAHGLGKFISHLGVCHYITKTHLGGQDTLHKPSLLPPLKGDFIAYFFPTKHKPLREKRERKQTKRKGSHESRPRRSNSPISPNAVVDPKPEETQEGDARRRLQEGHDVKHTNDVERG